MSKQYTITMHSKTFGSETFPYDSLDEALVALQRLAKRGIERDDAVKRWFCLEERPGKDELDPLAEEQDNE